MRDAFTYKRRQSSYLPPCSCILNTSLSLPLTWATGDVDQDNKAALCGSVGERHVHVVHRFALQAALFITMKITDSSVICFHLQVLHGITVKSIEGRKGRLFVGGAKIFGVPLENLPRRYIPEFGLVPWWVRTVGAEGVLLLQQWGAWTLFMLCLSFLVDACSFLLERAGTVGLFRKPGSLPRIKTLRVRCGFPEASDCTCGHHHHFEGWRVGYMLQICA